MAILLKCFVACYLLFTVSANSLAHQDLANSSSSSSTNSTVTTGSSSSGSSSSASSGEKEANTSTTIGGIGALLSASFSENRNQTYTGQQFIVRNYTRSTSSPTPSPTTESPPPHTGSGLNDVSSSPTNSSSTPGPASANSTSGNPFTMPSPPPRSSPKPEVNPINTKLLLYTRRNPIVGHPIQIGDPETIRLAQHYRKEEPLRIIVHGSYDGIDFGHWMRDMKTKFLDIEDPNVMVVDWSTSAAVNQAQQRIMNARVVGHQIARVIEDFIEIHGTRPEDIHIIAHGDGTFAADCIGQRVKRIGRISGLNPSGPNFDNLPPEQRLDKSDALYVDVIHTDSQNVSLSLYRRGTAMKIGHVDFYPNGGIHQPGCNIDDFEDLVKKAVSEGFRTFLSCSHYRAIDYFVESIREDTKCLHMGYECDSYSDFLRGTCGHCNDDTHLCAEMGFRSERYYGLLRKEKTDQPIAMYFNTARRKPYCLYHYNIQVNVAQEPAQVRGGLLKVRVDGQHGSMDVKIYGGSSSFKAGYTTGVIATHPSDIGDIKSVSLNWMPNTYLTLLYGENLFIEDVRIAPIGWAQNKLKTDDVTTLCSKTRTGLVTPFYGETQFFKSAGNEANACSYQFTKY